MLPQNTTTIEQFIEAGSGVTVTYPKLSFLNTTSNGTLVTILNAISDYIDEFKQVCVNVKLNKDQQFKYHYKPKLLCQDIYGNPELFYIILLINDMADVKEFTKEIIKMPRKNDMSTILTYIYNAERTAIDSYNTKEE